MSDRLSPQQRHANMAAIHGKDTKPEMVVRRWLWGHGYRYRLNHPRLPGKPDIVMRKYRTCIFVNGCFWHGHHVQLQTAQIDNGKWKIQNSECCKIDLGNQRRAPASQTYSISSDDACCINVQNSDCCKIDLGNQRRAPASQTYSISSDDACCINVQNSECCKIPKTNREFWVAKIRRNQERDLKVQRELAAMGWHSITIWECELKPKVREKTLESLAYTLNKIFLQDHSIRHYEIPEEVPMMAAEDTQEVYGNKAT